MVEVKIDKKRGTDMLLTLSGNTHDIAQETAIMLVEICKAISNNTDDPFDEVFTTIVGTAKLAHFFKSKEEGNGK